MAQAEEFIKIGCTDDWENFWAENGEALADEVGDEATCFALALDRELMIGGGAAPLFRVGFPEA